MSYSLRLASIWYFFLKFLACFLYRLLSLSSSSSVLRDRESKYAKYFQATIVALYTVTISVILRVSQSHIKNFIPQKF